jgi:hypothetical protein
MLDPMNRSGRPAAMILMGLGLGAIAGAYLHVVAAWTGLALVLAGLGVAVVGRPRTVDDASGLPPEPDGEPTAERPAFHGLGTRVQQILRLAEEQANDHRAKAEREAQRIVADAQVEAQTIIEKAREQAP